MRQAVDRGRIEAFFQALGRRFRRPGRIYLVGGATIVLRGLRASTLDIDIAAEIAPAHREEFVAAVRALKEELQTNVEEAHPAEFIPLPEGSEDRAVFVGRFGELDVYHFDPYSTALSKIERGTEKDFDDVAALVRDGMVERKRLHLAFDEVMRRYGRQSLRQDPPRFRSNFAELLRRLG